MATEWWWFLIINAIVAAVAVLSVVRPPLSPRGDGITRRASSAMLQRLRSSIFSFPSASFHTAPTPLPHPEASSTTAVSQETEEPAEEVASTPNDKPASTPRPRAPLTPRRAPASAKEEEGAEKEDPNAMSMEEAYALVVQAARRQPKPEPEREVEAKASRSSDVDAKAEEFIQRFKEGLRQQRLNSIFNYTQMLKKRAFGGGGRQPAAQPDQR